MSSPTAIPDESLGAYISMLLNSNAAAVAVAAPAGIAAAAVAESNSHVGEFLKVDTATNTVALLSLLLLLAASVCAVVAVVGVIVQLLLAVVFARSAAVSAALPPANIERDPNTNSSAASVAPAMTVGGEQTWPPLPSLLRNLLLCLLLPLLLRRDTREAIANQVSEQ